MPYQALAEHLIKWFKEIEFEHVPRDENRLADALATLASVVRLPVHRSMESLVIEKLSIPATERHPLPLEDDF